jgi:hypothetical protein
MIRYILISLFVFAPLVQANDLSYKTNEKLSTVLSKKVTQLSNDLYLNVNFSTALSLVDERFEKEYSFHEDVSEQPMLTLSYRF